MCQNWLLDTRTQNELGVVIIKFTFDKNGRYEYPVLTLANIDKTELSIMEQTRGLVITPRFNAVSELTFNIYKEYNGITLSYYDLIVKNRLVHVEGWGWWIIYKTTETFDGGVPLKEVSCYSYEYVLNYKGVNLLDGTYKFYDDLSPEDTLLYKLFSIVPKWHIGHVDITLNNKYRTFDIPEATLYGFLMDDVSTTYQCIFQFDTENMTVNVYEVSSLVKDTDIMITFDNVAKEIQLEELDTDICTVLRVNGADNLSINVVNPLGDNRIFNFDYYKTKDWIGDQALIDKITAWENLIEEKRKPYADLLVELRKQNRDLLTLKAKLTDLNSELEALEVVRKNLMPTDPDDELYEEQAAEFKAKTDEVDAKNAEIKAKEAEIKAKQAEIDATNVNLKAINSLVKFENYFTQEEQYVLNDYIVESVYTDTNFVVTDDMTIPSNLSSETLVLTTTGTKKFGDLLPTDVLIDEQYIANQLLEQGQATAKTVSQPSFTFSLDTANFLFIEKFKPFIDQLQLGCTIAVEIEEGDWAYPILLEMSIDYDNPESFSMTFGNRFRLSDAEWTFSELHNEQVKTTSQVGSTLQIASEPVLNGTVSSFQDYMVSNLVAANQQIQSTVDNEMTIGSFGLRGRKKDDTDVTGYDPHQLWINNNLIAMTDDNWQTVKLAIGLIGGRYSVNAEVIAGTLIAGEQLTIKNNNNSFVIDANGAKMTNASIEVTNDRNKIVLNPDVGIQMSVKNPDTGEYDTNALMFSEKGVLEFSGTLRAATGEFTGKVTADEGEIGGWIIKSDGLRSSNEQVYLYSDGNISASTLNTETGYIGDWQIDGNTISCGQIKMIATGTTKRYLGNGQWEYTPGTGRMELGKFIIDENAKHNYYIGGSGDSSFSDINKAQWGMSANNIGLCFYTGYTGGNVDTDYKFKVGNDGLIWTSGLSFDKGTTFASSWSTVAKRCQEELDEGHTIDRGANWFKIASYGAGTENPNFYNIYFKNGIYIGYEDA